MSRSRATGKATLHQGQRATGAHAVALPMSEPEQRRVRSRQVVLNGEVCQPEGVSFQRRSRLFLAAFSPRRILSAAQGQSKRDAHGRGEVSSYLTAISVISPAQVIATLRRSWKYTIPRDAPTTSRSSWCARWSRRVVASALARPVRGNLTDPWRHASQSADAAKAFLAGDAPRAL